MLRRPAKRGRPHDASQQRPPPQHLPSPALPDRLWNEEIPDEPDRGEERGEDGEVAHHGRGMVHVRAGRGTTYQARRKRRRAMGQNGTKRRMKTIEQAQGSRSSRSELGASPGPLQEQNTYQRI